MPPTTAGLATWKLVLTLTGCRIGLSDITAAIAGIKTAGTASAAEVTAIANKLSAHSRLVSQQPGLAR